MTMPRDPQGAGTRTETKVEWRNVYRWRRDEEEVSMRTHKTRPEADKAAEFAAYPRIAIERIETTTTITREEL